MNIVESLRVAVLEVLRDEGLDLPVNAVVIYDGASDDNFRIRAIEWLVNGASFELTEKGLANYPGLLDRAFERIFAT